MKRTALIVGAGVGGLSAAIALRHAGWNVGLFEHLPATAANGPDEGLEQPRNSGNLPRGLVRDPCRATGS